MAVAPTVGYVLLGPSASAGDIPDMAALYDALGAHSPGVEPDPPGGGWLDLRVGGRRAPPLAARAAAVLATARAWGYPAARLGIAPTPSVARLAARHGATTPLVLDGAAVAGFLAPLPLAGLGLDEDTLGRLALVGLRTLGAVAALPRGALGDYLGPDGPALEALARGADARPLCPHRPPLVLRARRDFDDALADRAVLAGQAERLLAPLLAQLRRQGLGATAAAWTLTDTRGRRVRVVARPGAPTAAAYPLLHALLAALPGDPASAGEDDEAGGFASVAVRLTAPRPLAGRQASFFDVPQGQRGRLQTGLIEARRRAHGEIGRFTPCDPAHPLPERRYTLAPAIAPGED